MSNNANVRITTETTVKQFAEVVVNGQSKGKREINGGPSLKDFATTIAKEFGIRTFTVSIDGDAVTTENASAPVPAGSSVSVQAKDSRGAEEESEVSDSGEGDAGDEAETEAEVPAEPVTT